MEKITVLQLVDDTILFMNNTEGLSFKIHSCLTIFSLMIAHKINLNKSIIVVGDDLVVPPQIVLDIGCMVGNLSMAYLGIPLGERALNCSS